MYIDDFDWYLIDMYIDDFDIDIVAVDIDTDHIDLYKGEMYTDLEQIVGIVVGNMCAPGVVVCDVVTVFEIVSLVRKGGRKWKWERKELARHKK